MNIGTLTTFLIENLPYMALFSVIAASFVFFTKSLSRSQAIELLKKKKVQNRELVEFISMEMDKIMQHMEISQGDRWHVF